MAADAQGPAHGLADGTLSPAFREIGNQATWSTSSSKGSLSVQCLRDGDLGSYWQYELRVLLARPRRPPRLTHARRTSALDLRGVVSARQIGRHAASHDQHPVQAHGHRGGSVNGRTAVARPRKGPNRPTPAAGPRQSLRARHPPPSASHCLSTTPSMIATRPARLPSRSEAASTIWLRLCSSTLPIPKAGWSSPLPMPRAGTPTARQPLARPRPGRSRPWRALTPHAFHVAHSPSRANRAQPAARTPRANPDSGQCAERA